MFSFEFFFLYNISFFDFEAMASVPICEQIIFIQENDDRWDRKKTEGKMWDKKNLYYKLKRWICGTKQEQNCTTKSNNKFVLLE